MGGVRGAMGVVLVLAVGACVRPSYPEGLECGPQGECPPGQSCMAGICRSHPGGPAPDARMGGPVDAMRGGPPDACHAGLPGCMSGPPDARPPDARPPDANLPCPKFQITTFPVGGAGVAVGDLNGDGKLDVATGSSSGTMVLLFQQAGGSLGGEVDVPLPAGTFPYFQIADLNHDGKNDLIVPSGQNLLVALQDPATAGKFGPFVSYSAGPVGSAVYVAVGDFDGDLLNDVVTSVMHGGVSVLLGDLTMPGTLLAAKTFGTGVDTVGLAIGDFNGDGAIDIAYAQDTGVFLVPQNPAAKGQFLAPRMIAGPSGVGFLFADDVNADGHTDLITPQRVYLQDPANPGTFLAGPTLSGGGFPAALGDVNGDGRADLVSVQTSPTATVVVSLGTVGGFTSCPASMPIGMASGIALGDVNGDGKVDVVVGTAAATDQTTVLIQQ